MRILRETTRTLMVELGALTVTALADGGGDRGASGPFAFLVRGPQGCLLIDAGAGPGAGGRLAAALGEAGSGPGEVTAVALTHTDPDQTGGLVEADGGPAFPLARRLFVATEELDAFRARPALLPVLARVTPLEQGDGPMPGVTAVNAPGHSPGHMAFLVEGRMLVWGDLVRDAADIACDGPLSGWDADAGLALRTRAALVDQAAEAGWIIGGARLPGKGVGWIDTGAGGPVFRPARRGA